MLSPAFQSRLNRYVEYYRKGIYTDEEFSWILADMGKFDRTDVMAYLEPDLVPCFKAGLLKAARSYADEEHLEPVDSAFSANAFGAYYEARVSKVLFQFNDNDIQNAAVVSLPSFDPEWCIRLIDTRTDGHWLKLAEAETSIYLASSPDVPVKFIEIEINTEFANLIHDVWRRMLRQTRYPKGGSSGLDGTTYHFVCRDHPGSGLLAGSTWTPNPETKPGLMVQVSYSLREYIQSEASLRFKHEAIILENLRQLQPAS